MGDMGEYWRDAKDHKRAIREAFGLPCPACREKQPRRHAALFLRRNR
jgi:hypothetical protein